VLNPFVFLFALFVFFVVDAFPGTPSTSSASLVFNHHSIAEAHHFMRAFLRVFMSVLLCLSLLH